MKDPERHVRRRIAQILGKIGDKSAIPALKKLLNDEYTDVRDAAAEAVQKIEEANISN